MKEKKVDMPGSSPLIENPLCKLFHVKGHDLVFYMDRFSNLFWSTDGSRPRPLASLPYTYQNVFFSRFLNRDDLSTVFADMEVIGAIDLFVKSKFCSLSIPELVKELRILDLDEP